MRKELTKTQREILDFLVEHLQRVGYPPTVREIAKKFELRGPRAPKEHLDALERKGYIKRERGARAIEIVGYSPSQTRPIPVVGRIAAGKPLLALENIEGEIALDSSIAKAKELFFLRVKGESMVGANILEGDLVLVKPQPTAANGEIVVALIDDEATLKRFFKEKGRIRLQPENSEMEPIWVGAGGKEVRIVGKVVGLWRRF